jgi:hypothetical protein
METKPRKAIINLDWLDAEIENLRGGIRSGTYHKYIGTAKVDSADMAITLDLVRSKCEPVDEDVNFSSEYHPESLLEKLATSKGNYINLLCSDMVKHWDNHYGESTMERLKHRAFGKGYKLTLITGGWSGNEDLVNAIKMNPISQLCYIKWESGGLHEFFISPSTFGYYTQSDLARKLGVSRQYVNSNKSEYEIMRICGAEYLKIPPTGKTVVR